MMSLTRPHHRFSVAEYDQMIDLGILNENDRVELIRGEIIKKMSIGDLHASTVHRLNQYFTLRRSDKALASIQNPIRLVDSEPEPDVALLKPREDFYASGTPVPDDVLLLIEVADSTLDFDREVKLPIYAENRIVEYWIVNLVDRVLEVYRQPRQDGAFAESRTLNPADSVEPVGLPGVVVRVVDVFGAT